MVGEKKFDTTSEALNDLEAIIALRHRLIHNFLEQDPADKYIQRALSKNIALRSDEHLGDYVTWDNKLCTTETIRWCISVLSDLAAELKTITERGTKPEIQGFPKYGVGDAKDLLKNRHKPRVPHELYFPTGK